VCAAVAFAHRHLVAHRDLKPAIGGLGMGFTLRTALDVLPRRPGPCFGSEA
jgi:hypothetical protein